MEKDRRIGIFLDQQQKKIDQAVGRPLKAIREICKSARDVITVTMPITEADGSTTLEVQTIIDGVTVKKMRASWEFIKDEDRITVIDTLQQECHPALLDVLRPVIAEDLGEHIVDHNRIATLGPKLINPSKALQEAVDASANAFIDSKEWIAFMKTLRSQDLVSAEKYESGFSQLLELKHDFPELADKVHEFVQQFIDGCTSVVQHLRKDFAKIQDHDEFTVYLLHLHDCIIEAFWEKLATTEKRGLDIECLQTASYSIMQSVAVAKLIDDDQLRPVLFPPLPSDVQEMNEQTESAAMWRKEAKQCLDH